MNVPNSWRYRAFLGLVAAALLPWIGHQMRRQAVVKCSLDGAEIRPMSRVVVKSEELGESQFCSIYCAEKWLRASQIEPGEILVTDEITGQLCDAADVFFVRSQIVAHGAAQDRRHAFARYHDAKEHAESHHGRILDGIDRPFASLLDRQLKQTSIQTSSQETQETTDIPGL